ncbi:hypothetical protein GCM10022285_11850 [Streptomyces tunisiensis]|uniref:Uncharacterized protein n=1 Tax=Streptomyces tunisiensis TaxID=948699 RepID=A0ABP7XWJ4_9ACTN
MWTFALTGRDQDPGPADRFGAVRRREQATRLRRRALRGVARRTAFTPPHARPATGVAPLVRATGPPPAHPHDTYPQRRTTAHPRERPGAHLPSRAVRFPHLRTARTTRLTRFSLSA